MQAEKTNQTVQCTDVQADLSLCWMHISLLVLQWPGSFIIENQFS